MKEYTKNEALDILKENKEYLELMLITQSEYDHLKDKMKPFIMSEKEDEESIPSKEIELEQKSNLSKDDKLLSKKTESNVDTKENNEKKDSKPGVILECDGVGHTVTLFPTKVEISGKKSLTGMLVAGGSSQIIRIKNITDVEFKEAGGLIRGYIQFRTPSSGNTKQGGMLSGFEVADDPNTVHFTKEENENFLKLKSKIEELLDERESGNMVNSSQLSSADELKKFAELKDQGIISEKEFESKKKELLGL